MINTNSEGSDFRLSGVIENIQKVGSVSSLDIKSMTENCPSFLWGYGSPGRKQVPWARGR